MDAVGSDKVSKRGEPRKRPHVCHKCGKAYTGWRCPDCYKRKKSGRGSGGQGGRRGSRLKMQLILSSSVLPVTPEAAATAAQSVNGETGGEEDQRREGEDRRD